MNFDLLQIPLPFRMQPGMRRMAAGEVHLHRLSPHSRLYREKQAVLADRQALYALPGFDVAPAFVAIADRARTDGVLLSTEPVWATPDAMALTLEQDLAILDGQSGRIMWLCVCTPSHWAPETRIGQSLSQLHAGVADNALLQSAAPVLQRLVVAGDCWERFVWTISPSGRHDQHPHRHQREPWPRGVDAPSFAAGCHWRVERQTFFPVPGALQQAVFTIRVSLQPLPQAVTTPQQAQHLHAVLGSMSDAVLDYKNLSEARDPLMQWLESLAP